MLTSKQQKIFSAILDLNFEGKLTELALKMAELKKDMGDKAYNQFMATGALMFTPARTKVKTLMIFRLHDPSYGDGANRRTLCVNLNPDNTLNYPHYGGWQNSGSGYSISNMQLKESLPMHINNMKDVHDLYVTIKRILRTGCGSNKINSYEIINEF